MDLATFRGELRSREDEAPVWLVYLDDAVAQLQGAADSLLLQRAFWTRGEAYAYAQRCHGERPWHHFYVFRLVATVDAVDQPMWEAAFEMAFERATAPRAVGVSPTAVAQALGGG